MAFYNNCFYIICIQYELVDIYYQTYRVRHSRVMSSTNGLGDLCRMSTASKIFLSYCFFNSIHFVLIPLSITHCSFFSILYQNNGVVIKSDILYFMSDIMCLKFFENRNRDYFTLSALSRALTLSMVARSRFSNFGNSHRKSALSRTNCLCTFVSWSKLFSKKEIFCFWASDPPSSSTSSPAADFLTRDWRS